MQKKLIAKNILISGVTRVIIMILGIVMPRLLITSFGSEVNGLLSTITQIFTYLALLEAGIGTSTVNALYIPISSKERDMTNEIVTEARRYYRKVSVIYGGCILLFASVYPFLARGDLSKSLILQVILLQGASSFLYFFVCAVYEQILMADGRKYVLENVHFFSYVFQTLGKIVLIYLGVGVLFLQVITLCATVIRIFVLKVYAKKRYPWLNFKTNPSRRYLKERKAFVVHEISSVVFNNTDVILVSSFCGFSMASVYTLYNTIYSSLNSLLTSVNSGLSFVLGQNLNKEIEEVRGIYDIYNSLYNAATFICFTLAAILTRPFMVLYTAGVTDTNYLLVGLTFLFVASHLLSGVRAIASRLITVSGHADKTKGRSVLESIINLGVSIALVFFLDIYGVLLGTIAALLYRTNDIIIYANRKILLRSPLNDYWRLGVNLIATAGVCFVFRWWNPAITGYASLFGYAVLFGVLCLAVFGAIAVLSNFSLYKRYWKDIKNKLKQSKKA